MEKLKELWRNRWVSNGVFLLVLAAFFFTDLGVWVRSLTLSSPKTEMIDPQTSQSVYGYDFRMLDEQGQQVKLSDFKGKPIFLNFWASWCGPCKAEFGSLSDLYEQVEGVEFLFITREDQDAFDRYVSSTSHELPFYRQVTGAPPAFASQVIPATFVLNAEGKVVYSHRGAADWDDKAIVEMLENLVR